MTSKVLIFLGCALIWLQSNTTYAQLDQVTQLSTIPALLEGLYDGQQKLSEFRKYGNFGLGTYHALDGEMVILNNQFYKVGADGRVSIPSSRDTTPFITTTFFGVDQSALLEKPLDYTGLKKELDQLRKSNNVIYAIRIDGVFTAIKTRSVPKQQRPYPRLADVVKTQPEFEFTEIKGTMVGFWFPEFLGQVNAAGYHFHFLTADRQQGGHVLSLESKVLEVKLDASDDFKLILPKGDTYKKLKLQ